MVFYYKPAAAKDPWDWRNLIANNSSIFQRDPVKAGYRLDSFFLDLEGKPEFLISAARYYLQLFSHQRSTMIWKGMLQVRLDDAQDDADAMKLLSLNLEEGGE